MDNLEITVPFPPEITAEDVIRRRSPKKLVSRAPNKFIIYRLAYLKQLRKKKNIKKVQMTKTSSFISKAWNAERPEVKQEYKELANKVEVLLKQVREKHFVIVPEIPRRRGSAQPTIPPPSSPLPSPSSLPPPSSPPLPSSLSFQPSSSIILEELEEIFDISGYLHC